VKNRPKPDFWEQKTDLDPENYLILELSAEDYIWQGTGWTYA